MGTQIHIMNLEIDLLAEDTLLSKIQEYLSNDYLNVVHLVSMDDIQENNNETYHVMEGADLVLPGERAILSAHHVDVLESGGMVVDYNGLFQVMKDIDLEGKKCYFVIRTKKEAKSFYRIIRGMKMGCEGVGIYAADSDLAEASLINDINSKVPDIIYLALERGEQEKWISENRAKLNAKICICVGSVLSMIRMDNPAIPGWIRVLHLSRAYKAILRFPASHFFRKRIFQKKMADYNNKKQSGE